MKRLIFMFTLAFAIQAGAQQWSPVTNSNIWNLNTGNVGIGTTSPQYKLDINGKVYLRNIETIDGWSYSYLHWAGHSLVMGSPIGYYANNSLDLKPGGVTKEALHSQIRMYTSTDVNQHTLNIQLNSNADCFFNNTGNVGIGTMTPEAKLDVNGAAQVQKIIIKTPNHIADWNTVWQSGFFDSNNGHAAPEPGWFWGINMGHESNHASYHFGGQILIKNNDTSPTMYFRSRGVNGEGTWAKILHNRGNQDINGSLTVDGTIKATEIRVQADVWSDFVFDKDYKLRSLADVQLFINANGHLPEIPSASEVKENGIDLADMNAKLLQKVEELTLYVIELNKRIEELENNNRIKL